MATSRSLPDSASVVMLLLVVVIWAGSFIFIKLGLSEIPPITLALIRFVVAFPVLAVAAFIKDNGVRVAWRKHFLLFTVLALTGVTLLYIFQFYALSFTTAAAGAIIINITVVFIALLSAVFLHEKLNKRKAFGILLAFFGVVIVISNESLGGFGFSPLEFLGGILMVVSAFFWAIYSILSKKILSTYSPLTINAIVFGLGTLYLAPLSLLESPLEALRHVSLIGWSSILYLAVLSSAVAYFLWSKVLTRIETIKAGVFLYGIPVFTMILSFIFLREPISYAEIVGLILVISGVYSTETG